jgi:hypothetical protein
MFEREFERPRLTPLPLSRLQNFLSFLIKICLQVQSPASLEILAGTSLASERAKLDLTSGGNKWITVFLGPRIRMLYIKTSDLDLNTKRKLVSSLAHYSHILITNLK